jgi:hypothetical protein
MNGELGHRGLRAGSPGSRERDSGGGEDFMSPKTADAPIYSHHWGEGRRQLHLRVARCANRQYLTKPPIFSTTWLWPKRRLIIVFDLHLFSCCSTPLFHVPVPAKFPRPSQCLLHAAPHTFAAPATASNSRILCDTSAL